MTLEKDPQKQIEKLNSCVLRYYQEEMSGHELVDLMKQVTSILYFLEETRSKIHDLWQTEVYNLTTEGKSVSRAENIAHKLHPEMYQLRHIMTAGYRIVDSIRTQVSYLKSELQHLNQAS